MQSYYTVLLDNGRIMTKHADQLRRRTNNSPNANGNNPSPEENDFDWTSPNTDETTPPIASETTRTVIPEAGGTLAVEHSMPPSRHNSLPDLSGIHSRS